MDIIAIILRQAQMEMLRESGAETERYGLLVDTVESQADHSSSSRRETT